MIRSVLLPRVQKQNLNWGDEKSAGEHSARVGVFSREVVTKNKCVIRIVSYIDLQVTRGDRNPGFREKI